MDFALSPTLQPRPFPGHCYHSSALQQAGGAYSHASCHKCLPHCQGEQHGCGVPSRPELLVRACWDPNMHEHERSKDSHTYLLTVLQCIVHRPSIMCVVSLLSRLGESYRCVGAGCRVKKLAFIPVKASQCDRRQHLWCVGDGRGDLGRWKLVPQVS
jgi:hypothetical protein